MTKKILIIGYGAIAQRHHRNLKLLLPNSKIKVFKKNRFQKLNNIEYLKNLRDAINFSPNITLICSPAPTHIKYAKVFSQINSSIFIEKPVATNINELNKFLKFIKNKKITILSGYNLRFNESLIFFQKILKKQVGKILSVRSEVGHYLPNWRYKDYTKTVSANKFLGGGAINELSHDIDILFMLFNKINFLYGISLKISDLKINVEDSAHAVFRSSQLKERFYIFLNMDFYRHDNTRSCTVIGSKASAKWDGISNQITIYKKNKKKPVIIKFHKSKNDSYINEMRYFINNVKKKKSLYSAFKQNLKIMKVIELLKKNRK